MLRSEINNNETNLISCTHIDSNSDLVCDECNSKVPFFEFTENKEVKSGIVSGDEVISNDKLIVSGNMPKDTTAKIDEIQKTEAINLAKQYVKDITEEDVHYAYDISLNANSNKFQPADYNQSVKVKISDLNLDTSKTYAMLHIKDDGTSEILPIDKITENEIEFKATSFSTYIIITVGTNTITFDGENFKVYDTEGNEITNGATVVDGTNFNFVIVPNDGYGTTAITCTNAAGESVITTSGNVRGMGGLITSVTEDLTVYVTTALAPVITTQPVSTKVTQSSNATFTVAATGTSLTYQWQYRESEDTYWKDITSSSSLGNNYTTATFTLTNTIYEVSGWEFRCLVGDANFTAHERVKSDIARVAITVGEVKAGETPVILEQPTMDNAKIEADSGKAKFTVKALGSNLTFTWQYRENRDTYWKSITSAVGSSSTTTIDSSTTNPVKSSTFTTATALYSMVGYEYRCLVGNSFYANHDAVKSDIVAIVLADSDLNEQVKYLNLNITKHPESQKVALGESATFTIATEGVNTYKWKYKASGDTFWTDCDDTMSTGYNTATLVVDTGAMAINNDDLTVTNNMSGYQFKCVVSNSSVAAHTKDSDIVMLSVAQEPVSIDVEVVVITGNVEVTGSNTVGSTLTGKLVEIDPSDCEVTYQWYSSDTNSIDDATPIDGATSETFTITEEYVNKYLFFEVTASKSGYTTKTFYDITTTEDNESDTVVESTDIASTDIKVVLSETLYYYDGTAKEPTATVTIDGVQLTQGTDYEISYENNIKVGTASAIITGIGQYSGSITENFIISPAETDGDEVIVDTVGPTISNIVGAVTADSITVTADITDPEAEPGVPGSGVNESSIRYALTEAATAPAEDSSVWQESNIIARPKIKIGYIWIKAADNVGNVSINTNPVSVKLITSITGLDVTIDETVDYIYNGQAHKPTVTVTEDGVELVEGTDYTVTYENNINAGTAIVIITGKDLYEDSVERTFTIKAKEVDVVWGDTTLTFNGKAQTPTATVPTGVNGETISLTISGAQTNVGSGYTATAGSFAVTGGQARIENYSISNTETEFEIVADANMTYNVTLDNNTFTYDGTAHKPTPTVKVTLSGTETTLVSGTDYDVSYTNNINAGTSTAIAKITFKGNYTGSVTKTFTIAKKAVTVVWGETSLEYTGKAQRPTATISSGVTGETINLSVSGEQTDVGTGYTATVDSYTVSGGQAKAENYALSNASINFEIVVDKDIEFNVTLDTDTFEYDGTAHEPEATIKVTIDGEEVTLEEGKDYEVTYDNNVDAGTPTVTITGIGNYEGIEEVVEFTIEKKSVAVVWGNTTLEYTGKAQKPTATVASGVTGETINLVTSGAQTNVGTGYTAKVDSFTVTGGRAKAANYELTNTSTTFEIVVDTDIEFKPTLDTDTFEYDGTEHTPEVTVKVTIDGEEVTLEEGKDYEVTYDNNVDAGTPTVTITGKDNYEGIEKVVEFTIEKKSVAVVWGNTTLEYNGNAQKPTATVATGVTGEIINLVISGEQTNVGSGYTATVDSFTVTGGRAKAENYELTNTSTKFDIILNTELNVTLDKDVFTYDGSAHTPTPTVKITLDGEEITLTAGTHYDVTYNNNVNAGTATVTITGKGNYAGLVDVVEYTINKKSLTVVWSNTSLAFNFLPQKPTATAATGVTGETISIVVSGEQTNVGSGYIATVASFTVTGGQAKVDNYELTNTSTEFEIVHNSNITITPEIVYTEGDGSLDDGSFDYTGSAHTPDVKVTAKLGDEEVILTEGTDYEVSYENNIDAGTATVIITGKGNYEGIEETIEFTINKKAVTVVWANTTLEYNGKAQKPTATVVTGVTGETITLVVGGAQTKVGSGYTATIESFTVTGGRAKAENYELVNDSTIFEIVLNSDFNITLDDDTFTYDGTAHEPEATIKVTLDGEEVTLVEGTDYEVTYDNNVDAGTPTVTIIGKGNYDGLEYVIEYTIKKKVLPVTWSNTTLTYNGKAQKPTATAATGVTGETISIVVGGAQTNVGSGYTATADTFTVTGGQGKAENYELSNTFTEFEIIADVNISYNVTLDNSVFTYKGSAHTPIPTVKVTLDGTEVTLKAGTDYDVAYANNVNAGTSSAIVTITGKGNFTGSTTKTFSIAKKAIAVEWGNTTLDYNGKAQLPTSIANTGVTGETINLEVSGAQIEVGTGYTATVDSFTVTGGQGKATNYSLSNTSTNFEIVVDTDLEFNVTLDSDEFTYDGTAHEPGATIKVTLGDEEVTLVEGTDYEVAYDNNIDAGTATVTITGKDNYEGIEKVVEYTINKKAVSIEWSNTSLEFNGKAQKPTAKADSGVTGETINLVVSGEQTNVGSGYTATISSYTVTGGRGKAENYELSNTSTEFEIILSNELEVTIDKDVFTYDGTAHKPTPTVTILLVDTETTLTAGTDYDVAYANNVNAGTATVTVTGKGNYSGLVEVVEYTINKKALAVTWTNTTLKYNGTAQHPTATVNTGVTGETISFVISGAQTNVGSGYTAKVDSYTVTGGQGKAENYSLSNTTTTFEIVVDTSLVLNTTLDNNTFTYDGNEHTPTATVKTTLNGAEATLVEGTDYTVTYDNNIDAGTATVTITGKGNYAGLTDTVEYTINKKPLTVTWTNTTLDFNGKAQKPTPSVTTGVFNEVIKFAVSGEQTNVGSGYIAKIDSYTVTGGQANPDNYELSNTSTEFEIVLNAEFDVTIDTDTFTYDGTAHTPTPTVKVTLGGEEVTLKEGTDYTVTYTNNVNAGTATVTVTGKGNYASLTETVEYTIKKKVLTVVWSNTLLEYNAKPQKPTATAATGVTGETVNIVVSGEQTNVGSGYTATVGSYTVTGGQANINNYELTNTSTTFSIILNVELDVTLDNNTFTYNGSAHTPGVTVKVTLDGSEITLVEGTEYEVTYANNVNAGTATVTVTGVGNYDGVSKAVNYTINTKAVSVVWSNTTLTFNGKAQKPTATVTTGVTGETMSLVVSGEQTNVGSNYTVTAGSFTVTGGQGKVTNYTVTNTSTKFEIIVDTSLEFNVALDKDTFSYNGTAHTPTPTVKVTLAGTEVTLVKGTDYEVSYSNNVNAGTSTTKPSVTITGKGNYAGLTKTVEFTINKIDLTVIPTAGIKKEYSYADPTLRYVYSGNVSGETPKFSGALARTAGEALGTYAINAGTLALVDNGTFKASNYNLVVTTGVTFEIVKANISVGTLTLNPTRYDYDGMAHEPDTTVVVNGKTLVRGTDYDVTYEGNIEIGTAIARITGKGNYEGQLEGTFEISKPDISYGTLTITPTTFAYDGMEKRPETTVVYKGKTLIKYTDYDVEYYNNVNVGDNTAYVIVKGVGNYIGELKATFSITAIKLDGTMTLNPSIFEYDTTEKKPTVTIVTTGNRVLEQGVDFDVVYTDNVEVGIATATVTGKGNYYGTMSKTFEIRKGYLNITLKDKIAMYTGNEIAIDPAVINNSYEDLSSKVVYKYYADYQLEQALNGIPKDPGVYYVQASLSGMNNYNDIESNRAKLVIYGAPTKPIITGKSDGLVIESGTPVLEGVEVSIHGSDVPNVSNIEFGYKYSLDGTTWKEYTSSFEITTNGTTTVYAKAYLKENTALESEFETYVVIIDKTPPVIKDVIVEDVTDSVVIDVEVSGDEIDEVFITEDPTIDPTDDAYSGDWMEVGEDGGSITELTQGDGEKPIYVWAKDEAGNVTGPVQKVVKVNALKIGNQNDNKTTIMFKVSDKYLHTADITAENVALYVDGVLSQGKVTSLTKEAITNGYKYTAIIEDVTGNGALDIGLISGNVYDKAGNNLDISNSKVATNEITVDNTLPEVRLAVTDNIVYIVASDEHMKAVMLNGEILGRRNGAYNGILEEGINKVVVTDEYGNDVIQLVEYKSEEIIID